MSLADIAACVIILSPLVILALQYMDRASCKKVNWNERPESRPWRRSL